MKIQKQMVRHSFPVTLFSVTFCLLLCVTSCKKEENNEIHSIGSLNSNVGVFSVSATKKVVFAPGNLQWLNDTVVSHSTASNGTNDYQKGRWRFADHQYDIKGKAGTGTCGETGELIDLFGWGTSGYDNTKPYDVNTFSSCWRGIQLTEYDWGFFNTIYNPKTRTNDPYGTWHTLDGDEWNYLFYSRSGWSYNMVKIKFPNNSTVSGVLIYPDGWIEETWQSGWTVNNNTAVEMSKTDFESAEAKGCAFLPAAGVYSYIDSSYSEIGKEGYYWCSESDGETLARMLRFYSKFFSGGILVGNGVKKNRGQAVRLAREVKDNSSSSSD